MGGGRQIYAAWCCLCCCGGLPVLALIKAALLVPVSLVILVVGCTAGGVRDEPRARARARARAHRCSHADTKL